MRGTRAADRGKICVAGALNVRWPGLACWLHQDADGTPWLLVARDFPGNDVVHDTLRLDFDATGINGGGSPACINWDSGVRAGPAGIDTAVWPGHAGAGAATGTRSPQSA